MLQGDAAAAVAGDDGLVLVVGPAGAGKTRMLSAAVDDLHRQGRPLFGLAPTAKAARVLEQDTGMVADTVAKLLYEWDRPDRAAEERWRLPAGTTVVVDEAGMIGTPALHRLVVLAERQRWRLALVGDHRQLQAVGRGGLFHELCASGRVEELEQIHRFTEPWEAAASLMLRAGDPRGLDVYEAHGRIIAGTLDEHLDRIATSWIDRHQAGATTAMVASSNDHVDAINAAVQTARLAAGHLDRDGRCAIGGGERAHPGDVIATRRNDRRLITTAGEPVRNRETWTVTAVHTDGDLTVTQEQGHGTIRLPVEYVRAACPARLRGDRTRLRVGHRHRRHRARLRGDDTPRPLRRGHPRPRREPDLRHHRVRRRRRSPRRARSRPRRRPGRHPRRHPTPHPRRPTPATKHTPASPSRQPGRCPIPDWFADVLADARHALAEAEHTVASNTVERARRAAAVTTAEA